MSKLLKYKDKIISSEQVGLSFRGILKISPNDLYTYNEDKNIDVKDLSNNTNYSDEISPSTTEGNFTDANYKSSFLLCTDSDGYSVGFRLKKDAVEFDNLGIIGSAIVQGDLEIFKDKENNSSLVLNGCNLPQEADEEFVSDRVLKYKNDKWEYESIDDIITKYTEKVLKGLKTVPTGSIHWFPLTLNQYNTLDETSQLRKDYLLCDGKEYNSKDYEQLAKILDKSHEGKFNVPNLQDKFISAVLAKGSTKLNEKLSPYDIYSCDSGKDTPDCNDPNERPDTKQHRHFIAYGSWTQEPTSYDDTTYSPQFCSKPNGLTTKYSPTESLPSLSEDDSIGVLTLNNHAFSYYKSNTKSGMIGFGESSSSDVNSIPANILLSKPNHNKPQINCQYVGQSSNEIISGSEPSSNNQKENHGKFYRMLPFIKI